MSMAPESPHPERRRPGAPLEQAAQWVARRDRGLTREEQDQYLDWLKSDPRHPEAMRRASAALERMMKLYEWQPGQTAQLNPDLFQSRHALRSRWPWVAGLAAAASLALVILVSNRGPRPDSLRTAEPGTYLVVNERLALPDGSRIELKEDCQVLVRYSATERRVQLTRGEAHFTVWKDATRPFVVQVGNMEVVAVGTAFSVRWEQREMEVLVTSGSVTLEVAPRVENAASPPVLAAGYRGLVRAAAEGMPVPAPEIGPVASVDMARALAWLEPRLRFHETPLPEAVAQFNQLNRQQLVLGEPELTDYRVGGTFRPDNVEAFVRLLEITHKIRAERRGESEIVLRRMR